MQIYIVEGKRRLLSRLSRYLQHNESIVKSISSIEGCLFYLLYTQMNFDVIVLGENLDVNFDEMLFDDNSRALLRKLYKSEEYFPVAFGELCRAICREKGKKEPKIIIVTTFYYYKFFPSDTSNSPKQMQELINSHNMQYVDKSSADWCEHLKSLIYSD